MSSNSILGLCLIDIQQDFDWQHCGVWSQVSVFGRKIEFVLIVLVQRQIKSLLF